LQHGEGTLEGRERGGNQDRGKKTRSTMAVDPAAHRRCGDYRLVALVEQGERHSNDRDAERYSCGFGRRYDANSIDVNADQISGTWYPLKR
jgi:hypothetical protein